MVAALEDAGLSVDGLAEAIRAGDLSLDFVDQPSYSRFASLTDTTFHELSERRGIPLELLIGVREAMGSTTPDHADRLRESELPVVRAIALLLEHGVRPEVVGRAIRVYGDSIRRVAETEADWWGTDILAPLFRAGVPPAEIGRRTARFASELTTAGDEMLLALYHGNQSVSWMRNIFEGFESALASRGHTTRLEHPPAIAFLDITGYTRLTEERGDEAAADLARTLAGLVHRTANQHGGQPVKWLGDGVMFHFRDPGDSVLAALRMVESAAATGLPPAHVGIHAGPVLYQEGDYFGRTVNAAARISDYARAGEVLVSRDVVEATRPDGVTFAEIGPVELKGLSGAMQLYRATTR
jgi:adenylate cyclase